MHRWGRFLELGNVTLLIPLDREQEKDANVLRVMKQRATVNVDFKF